MGSHKAKGKANNKTNIHSKLSKTGKQEKQQYA